MVGDVKVLIEQMTGPGLKEAVDQIAGCCESIPANIAEGYGRGIGKDCCRFFRIAISSASELESRLRSAVALGRIDEILAAPRIDRVRRVRALTVGLMRWMERRSRR